MRRRRTQPRLKTKTTAPWLRGLGEFEQNFKKVPPTFLENWQLQLEADARKFGFETLRMLFLIHGGALIALLAFAGSTATAPTPPMADIGWVMKPFGYGLAVTVASAMSVTMATAFNTGMSIDHWVGRKASTFDITANIVFSLVGGLLMVVSLCLAVFGFSGAVDEYDRSQSKAVSEAPAMSPQAGSLKAEKRP